MWERELLLQRQIELQSGGPAEESAPLMALQTQRHIEAGFEGRSELQRRMVLFF